MFTDLLPSIYTKKRPDDTRGKYKIRENKGIEKGEKNEMSPFYTEGDRGKFQNKW